MALLSKYLSAARIGQVIPYIRGDVLDIGCQKGQFRELAREQIGRYVGIDIDSNQIERARELHSDCDFILCDVDDSIPEFHEEFDTVVMCAVIEHLFNQKRVMASPARALKPNGRIVITTPTPFGNDIVHRFGSAVGLFSSVARDDHIVIYNRLRFKILAREVGLGLERHKLFQLGCNQLAILRKPDA
jgi:2-polyprenyl-3-methyl-5-hydroxy-6-metoxy-1,4-benzoquinol methylase